MTLSLRSETHTRLPLLLDGSEGTYKNAATLPKIELFDNAIYQDALGVTHYENTDAYEAAQNAVANK